MSDTKIGAVTHCFTQLRVATVKIADGTLAT